MSYKYECKPCAYKTNRKVDYIRHSSTKKHMANHLICHRCHSSYTLTGSYERHMNKTPMCTSSNQRTAMIPYEAAHQLGTTIINNNSYNYNNTNIYILDPNSFKGAKHQYAKNLLSDNVLPFLHQDNLTIYYAKLEEIVKNDFVVFGYVKDFGLTSEMVDVLKAKRYDDEYQTLNTRLLNLSHHLVDVKKLDTIKGIEPLFRHNDIILVKLWLNPSLLTEDEIKEISADINGYQDRNKMRINAYVSKAIMEAFRHTYINTENPRRLCLFPENQEDIFYKDKYVKPCNSLKRLTREVILSVLNDYDSLNAIIFDSFNIYHFKEFEFDINYEDIYNSIANELHGVLEV